MNASDATQRLRWWEDHLAAPMFLLAFLFVIVLAGLFHRFPRLLQVDPEGMVILGGLAALWFLFAVDAVIRFYLRDRRQAPWPALFAGTIHGLLPPLRMGCKSQTRPNHVWLPILGWQKIDGYLRGTLERFFSVPMVCVALMVLPLFVIEYWWAAEVHAEPALALGLDIAASIIWLAFTVELVIMASVAVHPFHYCLRHWIDVAIVLLPAVEILPLFRLVRAGRVLRLEQLLRWGRLYRLRALTLRGWRAILLLQLVQRLTGRSLQYRLKRLQELLEAKEEEADDLRREIKNLEERIARKAKRHQEAGLCSPVNENNTARPSPDGSASVGAPGIGTRSSAGPA
jgi:voltage-gated potassium channel